MATLIKQVQGFVRGQNTAGANGLELIMKTIDHMFQHNDWTPLAWLINKSQATDKSRIRAIVGACVGGVKLTTSGKEAQKQPSGMFIKVEDNAGTTEKMAILRQLVADRESFRGVAVSEQILAKEKPVFDLAKYVQSVHKKLEKEGVSIDLLSTMLKAEGPTTSTELVEMAEAQQKAKADEEKAA